MANNSLITLNCPNCGSQLEVNSTEMKTNCKYCGTQILIKDFITERRIDKNDKIKALEDLVNNAANQDAAGSSPVTSTIEKTALESQFLAF